MRILLEGGSLLTQRTGVGNYTLSLTQGLVALGVRVFVLSVSLRRVVSVPGAQTVAIRFPARLLFRWWDVAGWPRAELLSGGMDVVHGPNFLVPPSRAPSVVTVHDVAFLEVPDTLPDRLRKRLARRLPVVLREAAAIIVPTEFVKRKLADWSGIDPLKIHPVPEAPRAVFRDPPSPDRTPSKFGIEGRYLLWAGAAEPRKNLRLLLQAFSSLAHEIVDVQLVLCGPRGWKEDIPGTIEALGLASRVRQLGYVDEKDLAVLMAGASCFVYPSIHEGFGLPALEAMAAGAPVVAARAGGLPEVVGDAALLVDPNDESELAEAILRVLSSEKVASRLRQDGKQKAEQFSWEETSRRTLEIYQNVSGRS